VVYPSFAFFAEHCRTIYVEECDPYPKFVRQYSCAPYEEEVCRWTKRKQCNEPPPCRTEYVDSVEKKCYIAKEEKCDEDCHQNWRSEMVAEVGPGVLRRKKRSVDYKFEFEYWATRNGAPFSTPETNDHEKDVKSSFDEPDHFFPSRPSKAKEAGGNFNEENGYVPLPPSPGTDGTDHGDQDSDAAKANHLTHADTMFDRSHVDLPIDSDPQIERLFFRDHEDLHEHPYDGDSPTHHLQFNDYNSHNKPFPSRCKFETPRCRTINVKKCLDKPVHKPRLHCPTLRRPRCHLVNEYVCKRVPRLNKCGYRERQAPRCNRVPRRVCDPVYDDYGDEVDEEQPVCKFLPPKEVCANVKVGVPKRVPRVKTTEYCKIPRDWRR